MDDVRLRATEQLVDGVRRRRAGLSAALDRLDEVVAAPSRRRRHPWTEAVDAALDQVSEALAVHVRETESPDGLFTEVLNEAPHLGHRVERLRDDHDALEEAVEALRAHLQVGDHEAVRAGAAALRASVDRHRGLGTTLLYEAFQVDLSGGD